ncbi:2982_t:CDS:2, partial [Dentiscutata heterogama]
SVHNNKDCLNLNNFDGESSYNLSQDNENIYEPTQDSNLIQDASLATDKNYNKDEE